MKPIMAAKKTTVALQHTVTDIADTHCNWDSIETMAAFYTEEIKKTTALVNTLSILDNTKQIISLCGKIKMMKEKLRRKG